MPDGLLLPLGIHTIPEREKIMKKTSSVKETVFVGMMGAISAVLMLLNISLPFTISLIALHYTTPGNAAILQQSELLYSLLFAGFFLGPVSGCGVIVVKILLKILFQGTDTGYVGEVMNVLGSMCFILPASLIYRWKHTKKGAVIAMAVSTVLVSIAFIFINAYIAFPLFSKLYGMPMEAIIGMGAAINPRITDLPTLMLFSVFPFNLFKHGITSFLTYLVYKRIGNRLRAIVGSPEKGSYKAAEGTE